MPSKKKTVRKSRAKKPSNKKSLVRASVVKSIEPVAEPIVTNSRFRWEFWAPLFVLIVLLVFFSLNAISGWIDKAAPAQSTQSPGDSLSELRVVPGQEGGTSSTRASGALQPQSMGLQQAQPTTQSAGGLNLQAQSTPNQATVR